MAERTARTRKSLTPAVRLAILTESGYRCTVPTCRTILAIDIHHIVELSKGGTDDPANLIALCPTCHALYHRGTIEQDSMRAWKAAVVAFSHAYDSEALDLLLFLSQQTRLKHVLVSGDGVLRFARLIANDLATYSLEVANGPLRTYSLELTARGRLLLDAWQAGDAGTMEEALQRL